SHAWAGRRALLYAAENDHLALADRHPGGERIRHADPGIGFESADDRHAGKAAARRSPASGTRAETPERINNYCPGKSFVKISPVTYCFLSILLAAHQRGSRHCHNIAAARIPITREDFR